MQNFLINKSSKTEKEVENPQRDNDFLITKSPKIEKEVENPQREKDNHKEVISFSSFVAANEPHDFEIETEKDLEVGTEKAIINKEASLLEQDSSNTIINESNILGIIQEYYAKNPSKVTTPLKNSTNSFKAKKTSFSTAKKRSDTCNETASSSKSEVKKRKRSNTNDEIILNQDNIINILNEFRETAEAIENNEAEVTKMSPFLRKSPLPKNPTNNLNVKKKAKINDVTQNEFICNSNPIVAGGDCEEASNKSLDVNRSFNQESNLTKRAKLDTSQCSVECSEQQVSPKKKLFKKIIKKDVKTVEETGGKSNRVVTKTSTITTTTITSTEAMDVAIDYDITKNESLNNSNNRDTSEFVTPNTSIKKDTCTEEVTEAEATKENDLSNEEFEKKKNKFLKNNKKFSCQLEETLSLDDEQTLRTSSRKSGRSSGKKIRQKKIDIEDDSECEIISWTEPPKNDFKSVSELNKTYGVFKMEPTSPQ